MAGGRGTAEEDIPNWGVKLKESHKNLQVRHDEIRHFIWPTVGPTLREYVQSVEAKIDRFTWVCGILGGIILFSITIHGFLVGGN